MINQDINALSLKIGTSSLPGVFPRFQGTKAFTDSSYGLISKNTSDDCTSNDYKKVFVNKALRDAHTWAVSNGVEVWLLPELCIDQEDRRLLINLINTTPGKLKIVLPGSTYENTATDAYNNRAPIWVRGSDGWDMTKHYNKMIPFAMNTDTNSASLDVKTISLRAVRAGKTILKEDFSPGSAITTFQLSDTKCGVAICRDVLDVFDKGNPLIKYCDNVNLMFVTSMNSGHTNLFTASAESMARWHGCTTIYVNNATSVLSESNNTVEMSFALLPDPSKVAGICGEIYYRKPPIITSEQGETCAMSLSAIDPVFEQSVTSIYSGSVKPCALPADGNVLYVIENGKLKTVQ